MKVKLFIEKQKLCGIQWCTPQICKLCNLCMMILDPVVSNGSLPQHLTMQVSVVVQKEN